MRDQNRVPLLEALTDWRKNNPISYHVPGHKSGSVIPGIGHAEELFKHVMSIDATELTGLDDLHDAYGVIKEAEELASELYGTAQTRFLVGGSTAGNLAMMMAACQEGDTVLVQKNCHKSIINGLRLTKAKPVFIAPDTENKSQVATGVTIDRLREAIEMYPEAKTLVLTYPNYYGMSIDIEKLITLAHQHHITVIVDEAHGAHFGKSRFFPNSSIEYGADLVVHSAHKTLPAMTMGAYLHIVNEAYALKVNDYLQMLQSSSPSYPIMASLDLARYYLSSLEDEKLDLITSKINHFKTELGLIKGVSVICKSNKGIIDIDPLKVTIQVKGLTGFQLAEELEQEGIFPELADSLNVLLVLPLASKQKEYEKTIRVFKEIANKSYKNPVVSYNNIEIDEELTSPAYSFQELEKMNKREKDINDVVGLICAKAITPYPPGIPVVMPGERFTGQHVMFLQSVLSEGGHVQGMVGNDITTAVEEE
ncbi:aminotransferase class I/II-fold pyridoxal phosphate-dependent enzyme [Guptibacillus algicola]|uniref:aminotransferase class I/II-fold pyridoxal phosphate-dependent enzyme n=1 Tax=Guptibacillus algicola TaxID=225844 RepID=UPI001CD66C9A|nr:aminotransferase class I/II-fold pyridoxal phosphate-dependent enzyme [Alkalihalobacillus algicola]MCA0989589.1 aminotransferase class I/II-fold pyridoxal phosphate-dependent enzyme [Alkalihalobacillus algicola]